MLENGNAFLKKLDELITLFEKLREKATKEGILLQDDPLYKNFELLAGNYRLIKKNIPEELIEEMGEPIKEMISEMVEQLKKDLGMHEVSKNDPLFNEIENIDKLLQSGNLSEEEINNLLDKRSKLNND